jgi:hypothetical protein
MAFHAELDCEPGQCGHWPGKVLSSASVLAFHGHFLYPPSQTLCASAGTLASPAAANAMTATTILSTA